MFLSICIESHNDGIVQNYFPAASWVNFLQKSQYFKQIKNLLNWNL